MSRLKIVTLHCFGSNPRKHANQWGHFVHCAQACSELAEWVYPAGPNLLEPNVVRSLLKNDMGCTDEEVEAFGFEGPRCWFRFTDNRYVGLEEGMAHLAEVCRRETGWHCRLLMAAARRSWWRRARSGTQFQSIRF
jgi:hypothetical protein